MKLCELLKNVKIISSDIDMETEVSGVTMDTRKGCIGALYAAVPSLSDPKRHGKDYIQAAKNAGAVAVLLDIPCETYGLPAVYVEDARRASAFAASNAAGNPASRMKIVGVTGTKGKTSTTHYIFEALKNLGISAGLIGTNEIVWNHTVKPATSTTPEATALYPVLREMADDGVKVVVMEVSSHALDVGRCDPIRFTAGVFLNLSQDHLDYFKTMEALEAAKARLGELSEDFWVNENDPAGMRMIERFSGKTRVRRFSSLPSSSEPVPDVVAVEARLSPGGVSFLAEYAQKEELVNLPTPGTFTVSNGLGALGALLSLDIPFAHATEALSKVPPVRGRAERVETGFPFEVMIDYAHSPQSLQEILRAVRPAVSGRLICVFGCGGNRDKSKRPIMGQIAAREADVIMITSDNPRFEEPEDIIAQIVAGIPEGKTYLREGDRGEAIRKAMEMAIQGDMVIVCGKGHENYQEIRGVKYPMDDRELVKAAADKIKQKRGGKSCANIH